MRLFGELQLVIVGGVALRLCTRRAVFGRFARLIFVVRCVTAFGRMGDYWRYSFTDPMNAGPWLFMCFMVGQVLAGRWQRKRTTNNLYKQLQDDATRRGDLPMVMCGDFNLEVADAPEEFETLKHARWVDCASWGIGGFDVRPTSLKGRGSRIDLGFVNQTAASLMRSYDLLPGVHAEDHMIMQLKLHSPIASQVWYMSRGVGGHVEYRKPIHAHEVEHVGFGSSGGALASSRFG